MSDLKEQFLQKMIAEKLDFLPLKESIELHNSGLVIKTRFSWVVRSEELEDNGDDMTTEQILSELEEIYGEPNDYHITIGNPNNHFDEFTLELCPAFTIGDLLK
jgi:hypothetical protein